jgi:hypothetical protein
MDNLNRNRTNRRPDPGFLPDFCRILTPDFFEGLGNDFYYDYNTNRTISVDIRYVLFVTEKFGGAKWVVDEMKVVGEK